MDALPPLRRLPVPRSEPPYDDEPLDDLVPGAPAPVSGVQGTLALAFTLPSGLPAAPDPSVSLRLLPDLPSDAAEEDPAFAAQHTARADLPEPCRWAGRLAQALVEVMAGDRPLAQLLRWTDEGVYDELNRRVSILAGRSAADRRRPLRAVVRSVRVSEPADGIAEACALVQHGIRSRALAFRLEGCDGRWRCTALQVG
jgi:Family of unknown function (DUF6459)